LISHKNLGIFMNTDGNCIALHSRG